jgi:uncharacterized protein YkwD
MPGFPSLLRALGVALPTLALLLSIHAPLSQPAEAFVNCDVADISLDAEERAFLTVINDYRAQRGVQPLTVSENLTRAATWMATDMGSKNYFSHGDSKGRSAQERIAECGGSMASGENLGAGPQITTAAQAFDLWHTSPAHDANMLYSAYRQIGIARVQVPGSYYTYYWVTTFDVHDDGTRAAGSTAVGSGATLIDPTPGSVIGSQAYVFSWLSLQGVQQYWLDIGSCPACNDIYSASSGLATSAMVLNLPRDGRQIYVRLSLRTVRGWEWEDYVYTSASFE